MMELRLAQRAYTQTVVTTSSHPLDHVILLYDEAIEEVRKALRSGGKEKLNERVECLRKAVALIEGLVGALDMEAGGEVAGNLQALYVFVLRELALANVTGHTERLEGVVRVLEELRSAWREVRNTEAAPGRADGSQGGKPAE